MCVSVHVHEHACTYMGAGEGCRDHLEVTLVMDIDSSNCCVHRDIML